jgi:RHS repeat-associated protein
MSGSTNPRAEVPLPGGGEAVYAAGTLEYYRHGDNLGSARLASTPSSTLYSATAYAPQGEAYTEKGTTDRSFTGQKHDTATGQYDFLLREYSPTQGRWWVPDPAGASAAYPENP